MPAKIDLVGRRFGRWTVLEETPKSTSSNHVRYLCKCDCGSIKSVNAQNLRKGLSKSCGCLKDEIAKRNTKDMVGLRFGKLVVVKQAQSYYGLASWECVCDCGNRSVAIGKKLRSGLTVSCGCTLNNACRREYERIYGKVPVGYKVTTRDGNKENLSPANLCLLSPSDYTELYRMIKGSKDEPALRMAAIKVIEIKRAIRDFEHELE